jgi:UDP-N-acetylmuramoyl-L-alanyl-D-glutamate--2,6-diaminopimelate ligase
LLDSVAAARLVGNPRVAVTGLAYDSRAVRPGAAFICVVGEKADGHCFIPQAVAQGAAALVVQSGREAGLTPPPGGAIGVVPDSRRAMAALARAFYDDPSSRLTLVGVTGTNGKTTTALMVDAIFRTAGLASGVIGTLEYRIGARIERPSHTTPEAVDLQGLLAELVEGGATHAAMEVSSHAIALRRVEGVQFAGVVFTNLTPEHLDFHPDMQDYLETKRRLFEEEGYFPAGRERVNAVNVDDTYGREIVSGLAQRTGRPYRARTLTYGLEPGASYRAEEVELGVAGSSFTAVLPTGREPIRMRLLGRFNVCNALGALTVCAGLGIPPDAVRQALETMAPVRGRFERVPARTRQVVVDYAHTPDGLERALETARQLAPGRVIVVFGCGGDRDRTKRPLMGSIGARMADRCVITSDNPRSERPEDIIAEIVGGIPEEARERCVLQPDRAAAIALAVRESGPEDVVLIAGKGHEDYQIFADRTIHFDDRQVAAEVIAELEGSAGA